MTINQAAWVIVNHANELLPQTIRTTADLAWRTFQLNEDSARTIEEWQDRGYRAVQVRISEIPEPVAGEREVKLVRCERCQGIGNSPFDAEYDCGECSGTGYRPATTAITEPVDGEREACEK